MRASKRGVVKAFAAPWSMRPPRKDSGEVATTQTRLAAAYATKASRIARVIPWRAPIVPDTSMSALNGIMYHVTAVAAVGTDVPSPDASSGSIALTIAPPNGPRKPPR